MAALATDGASMETMRHAALRIAEARPMMASVFDFANRLLFFLEESAEGAAVAEFCDRYLIELERSARVAVKMGVAVTEGIGCVVTHSASSMVKDTLIEAARRGRRFRVVCTESRPGNEGVLLAETLCREGIDTTLVIDAAAGFMMEEADLFLVGADGIGTFGLVHKMGTWPMALAARKQGVKFAVLTLSRKFWPAEVKRVEEPPKEGDEIVSQKGCFEICNRYFDRTPLEESDVVITERGVWTMEEALKICEEKAMHPLLKGRFSG